MCKINDISYLRQTSLVCITCVLWESFLEESSTVWYYTLKPGRRVVLLLNFSMWSRRRVQRGRFFSAGHPIQQKSRGGAERLCCCLHTGGKEAAGPGYCSSENKDKRISNEGPVSSWHLKHYELIPAHRVQVLQGNVLMAKIKSSDDGESSQGLQHIGAGQEWCPLLWAPKQSGRLVHELNTRTRPSGVSRQHKVYSFTY